MRGYLYFSVSFGLLKKRIPLEVFFNPFSNSLKLKSFLSDLVALHARQTKI
jgi:hypothetical protein